jgi:chemotaxis protein methyltransferase CheR
LLISPNGAEAQDTILCHGEGEPLGNVQTPEATWKLPYKEVQHLIHRAHAKDGLRLDESTFLKLRERILESSGILVGGDESARLVLERRLSQRVRLKGLDSFVQYEEGLNDGELGSLLDIVAVHETYFFRERKQLRVFRDFILEDLREDVGGSSRPLKIWSAGCSSGEEAYTIAILLAERGLGAEQGSVFASDLSSRVIEQGRTGLYRSSSFRTSDLWYREKYFSEAVEGAWRAGDQLRGLIRFSQSNIVRSDETVLEMAGKTGFDVIFCRNVLMYFDKSAVEKTLRWFHGLLREGGYLLVGHAEGLMPMGASFRPVHFGRETVHRK